MNAILTARFRRPGSEASRGAFTLALRLARARPDQLNPRVPGALPHEVLQRRTETACPRESVAKAGITDHVTRAAESRHRIRHLAPQA
jgi:hypothetical protein